MRETYSLNFDWKFCKSSEIDEIKIDDYFGSFVSNTKVGSACGARGDGFFDGNWETVRLPHDWSLDDDFIESGGVSGNKPISSAWYRKSFNVPKEWDGKRIIIKFDGIAVVSNIYLNNILVATSTSSYTPITIDSTDFLRYGSCNCLAVEVHNTPQEGWWYEGGGIYRNVNLIVTEKVAFNDDGIFVRTEKISDNVWKIKIRTEVLTEEIDLSKKYEVSIKYNDKSLLVPLDESMEQEMTVENPNVWDIDSPELSQITAELFCNGILIDKEDVVFGFREVLFTEKGCLLNGRKVKLKGVCLHHDHAGVGTAVPYALHLYRMKLLKSMGCNAIRTSHNPQSPEFYRACNEVGLLVMNETRHFSSTNECLHQLREFVRRDRNHPCVVMWSIFNEEPLQCSKSGEKMARTMKAVITKEDGTRPLTGGMNGPLEKEGVVNVVDVMGFNYLQYGYDEFHKNYPQMPIVGSETGSYVTTRGELKTNIDKGHFSAYGKVLWENLLPWSDTPGGTWRNIMEREFVLGGFYWTAFDYRGEAGKWPSVTSKFGAMDLCGFPKENYFWHRSLWRDEPAVFLAPHWNFSDGEYVEIRCYSNCKLISLAINGEKIKTWKQDMYDPKPQIVPFSPGCITAIGYDESGKEMCRDIIYTAGEATHIKTEVSTHILKADGEDTLILNVFALDENENIVPDFDGVVNFSLSGVGKILGTGNGDNASHEKDRNPFRHMFHGMCQAILQATNDVGNMDITINCENFPVIKEQIKVETCENRKWIPSTACQISIGPWRMSDIHSKYPTTKEIVNGLFTWIPTMVGYGKSLMMSQKNGFATVSGLVTIPNDIDDRKAVLVFERVVGNFDVYWNEEKIFSTEKYNDRKYEIVCPNVEINRTYTMAMVFKLNGKDCGSYGNIYLCFE